MSDQQRTPTKAEQDAVSYLEAGRHLTMQRAGLTPEHSFRVCVVWALSVIRHAVGGSDEALATFLESEAAAIRLAGAKPSGRA